MPYTNKRIRSYAIRLKSGSGLAGQIHVNGDDGLIGRINLYPDGDLPANGSSDGVPTMNYSISRLPDILDLLRNEDPVWYYLNEGGTLGWLGTAFEPAGEDDLG